jgi:hypothetical protein
MSQIAEITEKLKKLGIKRILVADDKPENLEAARACAKEFPELEFEFFASAKDTIDVLQKSTYRDVGLVLTDKQMELQNAGDYVALEAAVRGIPSMIVTRGDHHAGDNPWIATWSPSFRLSQQWYDTDKNNPEVWKKVLDLFTSSDEVTPQAFAGTIDSFDTEFGRNRCTVKHALADTNKEFSTEVLAALRSNISELWGLEKTMPSPAV